MTVFRFTAAANRGKPDLGLEDLAVLLRDGVDPVATGTVENDGNLYVHVDYAMDAVTARAWYDRYDHLGMAQVGS